MPSVSSKQRAMMGADLARARAGEKTRTGMSESQFEDFARKPIKNQASDDQIGMRAPAAGIAIDGHFFPARHHIPPSFAAKMTPEQRAACGSG